jgi:hypothetical protein
MDSDDVPPQVRSRGRPHIARRQGEFAGRIYTTWTKVKGVFQNARFEVL